MLGDHTFKGKHYGTRSGELEIVQRGKATITENKTNMLKPHVTTGVRF